MLQSYLIDGEVVFTIAVMEYPVRRVQTRVYGSECHVVDVRPFRQTDACLRGRCHEVLIELAKRRATLQQASEDSTKRTPSNLLLLTHRHMQRLPHR